MKKNILALSLSAAMAAAGAGASAKTIIVPTGSFIIHNGDGHCPSGTHLATRREVERNLPEVCAAAPQNYIVRLANGNSFSGSRPGRSSCAFNDDPRGYYPSGSLGHSLCFRSRFITHNWDGHCPSGTHLATRREVERNLPEVCAAVPQNYTVRLANGNSFSGSRWDRSRKRYGDCVLHNAHHHPSGSLGHSLCFRSRFITHNRDGHCPSGTHLATRREVERNLPEVCAAVPQNYIVRLANGNSFGGSRWDRSRKRYGDCVLHNAPHHPSGSLGQSLCVR